VMGSPLYTASPLLLSYSAVLGSMWSCPPSTRLLETRHFS
jgi:hypothetical protein